MIYADKIKKGDTIGICAPSNGITDKIKQKRLDNATKKLKDYGYNVIETKHVRKNVLNQKYNPIKAQELEELYQNDEIKYIICATGGDFLIETLDYINFDIIKKNIKWLQGYSDPTGLLFTITTNYDIATVYGYNISSYGMEKWHSSIYNGLELLEGKTNQQTSLDYYENNFYDYKTGFEEFHQDEPVIWKNLNNEKKITFHGRLIGGCLDIIMNLIGTKYDNTINFIEHYKNDGIIWYFDNCELSSEDLIRALWQLKNCNYFKYCNGIIFGRSMTESSYYNITFKDAIKRALNELKIPIIYDADIGHKQPQITIINGSLATITSQNGKGTIIQELK